MLLITLFFYYNPPSGLKPLGGYCEVQSFLLMG